MVSHKSRLIQKINSNLSTYGSCSSDFDLNPDMLFDQKSNFLEASVLIPVLTFKEDLEILLTKRSVNLRDHPGQIAFPGGKKEQCDNNPMETALREAEEEIGLKTSHVKVISSLPTHKTATGFTIKPYIGLVREPFKKTLQWGEVDEVFTVPFDHILDEKNFTIQRRKWNGAERRYYIVPFGPYYIWGATARILMNLSQALN
ncbi:NUDIX domain protein [SAR86 cluster bacterium SAR86E]|uniref:NUDIX domain protein n=1 Tax=SAR86 cluster bacterium SAR86E TaxID=1208365 RepID=K6H2A1_9GAMM|nr:NUDIX domain protein [SAR86 cluster bacterium SAR86E]